MYTNQRRPWGVSPVLNNMKTRENNIRVDVIIRETHSGKTNTLSNYQEHLSKQALTGMLSDQEKRKRRFGYDVPPYCPGCRLPVEIYMMPCDLCKKKYGPFENCTCSTSGSMNCMGESYHACCCTKYHPDLCLNEHYHGCICPKEGCLSFDHRK